jgi:hypothetical protein
LISKTINSVTPQAHPTMTEHERKKLCRVMDCQRLSLEACLHAAQNERLPLRVVVQVNPDLLVSPHSSLSQISKFFQSTFLLPR